MVMEVVHEDIGEDSSMQCTNHPFKNSTPAGGICAFCLQEKLGKLVSSSYPSSVFPSSSSSSPPSSRSTAAGDGGAALQTHHLPSSSCQSESNNNGYYTRKPKLPFVLTHKKSVSNKKKKDGVVVMNGSDSTGIVFKRSKSTATPRRRGSNNNIHDYLGEDYHSPNKRGFWSFLYLSKHNASKKSDGQFKDLNFINNNTSTPSNNVSAAVGSSSLNINGGDDVSPFERKVSRSRSVGCGSRSFSGDFFERISTGFGDCTLRRVESQREGGNNNNNKIINNNKVQSLQRNVGNNSDCIKERVRCGGIFSGFMIASSSNSSSYYIENSVEESNVNHVKSKSWVWAFASPMRAFGSKPSAGKRDANNDSSNKDKTPNLDAIPSLLTVSG